MEGEEQTLFYVVQMAPSVPKETGLKSDTSSNPSSTLKSSEHAETNDLMAELSTGDRINLQ